MRHGDYMPPGPEDIKYSHTRNRKSYSWNDLPFCALIMYGKGHSGNRWTSERMRDYCVNATEVCCKVALFSDFDGRDDILLTQSQNIMNGSYLDTSIMILTLTLLLHNGPTSTASNLWVAFLLFIWDGRVCLDPLWPILACRASSMPVFIRPSNCCPLVSELPQIFECHEFRQQSADPLSRVSRHTVYPPGGW